MIFIDFLKIYVFSQSLQFLECLNGVYDGWNSYLYCLKCLRLKAKLQFPELASDWVFARNDPRLWLRQLPKLTGSRFWTFTVAALTEHWQCLPESKNTEIQDWYRQSEHIKGEVWGNVSVREGQHFWSRRKTTLFGPGVHKRRRGRRTVDFLVWFEFSILPAPVCYVAALTE